MFVSPTVQPTGTEYTLELVGETRRQLTELRDECHNDLLDACRKMAVQRNLTMVSIMNMQVIKAMADTMPETEANILQILHVTQANFVTQRRKSCLSSSAVCGEHYALLNAFSLTPDARSEGLMLDLQDIQQMQRQQQQQPQPSTLSGSATSVAGRMTVDSDYESGGAVGIFILVYSIN